MGMTQGGNDTVILSYRGEVTQVLNIGISISKAIMSDILRE